MIFLKCLLLSAGVGLVALVGYLVYRLVLLVKATQQTANTAGAGGGANPPAGAGSTATPARPAVAAPATGKPVPWVGLAIIVPIVLAVALYFGTKLFELVIENTRLEAVRAEASQPRWGEIQKLTLTGAKTQVPWQEGAVRYETHLAHGENLNRRYWLKSGNNQDLFGEEDGRVGIELAYGQPCYLWSADGKPLNVEFQWKLK